MENSDIVAARAVAVAVQDWATFVSCRRHDRYGVREGGGALLRLGISRSDPSKGLAGRGVIS